MSKVLLIDECRDVVVLASSPHALQTPRLLCSEQLPKEWWQAVMASIRDVLANAGMSGEAVAEIGLTGAKTTVQKTVEYLG